MCEVMCEMGWRTSRLLTQFANVKEAETAGCRQTPGQEDERPAFCWNIPPIQTVWKHHA